jgi:DNA repair photolyase
MLAKTSGFRIGMISKSDLMSRDIDMFQELARRHYLTLVVTVTTLDRELARLLEPLAPRPDLRVATVRKLASAGLRVTVNCSPILPMINDSDVSIDAVAKAVANAGASGLGANILFLKDCSRAVFLPFLEEKFPHLLRRYRERYERNAYLRGAYPETIGERVHRIRKRYGLELSDPRPVPELWPEDRQMALFSEDK